jgi:hypothetical protein
VTGRKDKLSNAGGVSCSAGEPFRNFGGRGNRKEAGRKYGNTMKYEVEICRGLCYYQNMKNKTKQKCEFISMQG